MLQLQVRARSLFYPDTAPVGDIHGKRTDIAFHRLDAGISAIKLMAHTSIYYNYGSFKTKCVYSVSNSSSPLWTMSIISTKTKLKFQQVSN